ITPTSDGYIMVKNTGSNLLSITKLRSTSADYTVTSGIALLSAEDVNDILAYADTFDSLPTVDYTTEDTDTDTDTGEGDVTIDSPTEDDSQQEQQEEQEEDHHSSLFAGLIDAIRKWFQGRR
ncbi:MAG: hypothetical protein LUJ09_07735, partial [Firmicutes bacterium]|nr:hypothetical protein [Bacillota bacterium]